MIEDLKKIMNKNSILVGHSLENDLHSLKIFHDKIVDTAILFPKQGGYKFSLKTLAFNYLKKIIQKGVHDSCEDAKISMAVAKIGVEILSKFPK